MKRKAAWHRGSYHAQSRRLVAAAWADPLTRCRRCGLTHAEAVERWGHSAARWSAGHVTDGEVGGLLVPEHLHCNSSAGSTGRRRGRNRTSRTW